MSIITICTETSRGFYTKNVFTKGITKMYSQKCDHKNVFTKNVITKMCSQKQKM